MEILAHQTDGPKWTAQREGGGRGVEWIGTLDTWGTLQTARSGRPGSGWGRVGERADCRFRRS